MGRLCGRSNPRCMLPARSHPWIKSRAVQRDQSWSCHPSQSQRMPQEARKTLWGALPQGLCEALQAVVGSPLEKHCLDWEIGQLQSHYSSLQFGLGMSAAEFCPCWAGPIPTQTGAWVSGKQVGDYRSDFCDVHFASQNTTAVRNSMYSKI